MCYRVCIQVCMINAGFYARSSIGYMHLFFIFLFSNSLTDLFFNRIMIEMCFSFSALTRNPGLFTTWSLTFIYLCIMSIRDSFIDREQPILYTNVWSLLFKISARLTPATIFIVLSLNFIILNLKQNQIIEYLLILESLLDWFCNVDIPATLLILDKKSWFFHISLLFLRPYKFMVINSLMHRKRSLGISGLYHIFVCFL
mmetsp:Transcript_4461/g.8940  ORF Transcript_4461/g.8940 Transcript_4461/m.8940 type:complete len:200 (+) Transcript_4461:945-1544(+)